VLGAEGLPTTSGTTADGVARIGSSVTSLVLDFGVKGGAGAAAWLQSRSHLSYADNLNLSLNPNGGNVGIGTTNPSHKLAVNGTIKAKEVIVETTDWSDYVFTDDYRLAPLAEVEQHIREKKHLPGIPSAAEVAEHGVSMGEMQTRMLAKIEELTLHVITQGKAIQSLREENTDLREQISHLRGKL
jgi:hypothetical protein